MKTYEVKNVITEEKSWRAYRNVCNPSDRMSNIFRRGSLYFILGSPDLKVLMIYKR